jgi:hypothetical protein
VTVPLDYTVRPIVTWPGPLTARRQRARFKASWSDTLRLLERELRHLGARDVVLQAAVQPRDVRVDGKLRGDARPSHPGVILSFNSRLGAMSYPCDTFGAWDDNLRAIALSLEHLRTVDRYGVTRRGEQYRGFAALPPPTVTAAPLTVGQAARWLAEVSGATVHDAASLAAAYRAAAMKLHPDRGGSDADFQKLAAAVELLEDAYPA